MNTKGTYYGGSTAVQHTRQVVENIRRNGVNVLSYFIGDTGIYNSARGKFQTMYGQDARYVDVRSAHEVLTTLNEKLVATP
jgi:nitric oxide reductase activation protein